MPLNSLSPCISSVEHSKLQPDSCAICRRPQGYIGFPKGIIWPAEHLLVLVSCAAGSALTFRSCYTFVGLIVVKMNMGDKRFQVWSHFVEQKTVIKGSRLRG